LRAPATTLDSVTLSTKLICYRSVGMY